MRNRKQEKAVLWVVGVTLSLMCIAGVGSLVSPPDVDTSKPRRPGWLFGREPSSFIKDAAPGSPQRCGGRPSESDVTTYMRAALVDRDIVRILRHCSEPADAWILCWAFFCETRERNGVHRRAFSKDAEQYREVEVKVAEFAIGNAARLRAEAVAKQALPTPP